VMEVGDEAGGVTCGPRPAVLPSLESFGVAAGQLIEQLRSGGDQAQSLAGGHGVLQGIIWTAVTAAVMFALAAGKARTGRALGNPVLTTEGRVTFVDGLLATAVLLGVTLDTTLGWWWADPLAGYVIVYYAAREARACLTE